MRPLRQLPLRWGKVDQPDILHNPRPRQAPLRQLLRLLRLRMNLLRLPEQTKGQMKPPHSQGLLPTSCLMYPRFQSPWMPNAWQARVHLVSFALQSYKRARFLRPSTPSPTLTLLHLAFLIQNFKPSLPSLFPFSETQEQSLQLR